jgi:hypothetical protein
MKPLIFLAFVAALGSAGLASCKTDRTKPAVNMSPAAVAAVKAQLDVLRDSVDVKWQQMIVSDDQKVGTTGLLLKELAQQRGVDAAQVTALARANDRLKPLRYDQATMAESDRIDRYDAAQDSVLKALYPVATPDGNAATAQIRDFTEGIQQADNAVVGHRVGYDRAAKAYNDYLKLHREELATLGGKYAELQPLPLFTIGAK